MGTRRFSLIEATGLANSGSFTLPIDYDASGSLTVLCIGGGGGGGKRANSSGGAGGGGGGALAQGSLTGLKPGQVIYYSRGSGGTGGTTAGGQNGGNGGDSWVNISSNAAPTTTSEGVLAKGGSGNANASPGAGGSSASCIGSLGTASGGDGGAGGATNGSGGGGGGAAGRYTFSLNTYGTGGAGGAGYNVAGDGGGGGGGGVLGAGVTATTASGAAGGVGYGSLAGGAGGASGASGSSGSTSSNAGAGGGGGGGATGNSGFGGAGGNGAANYVDALSGALTSNFGYSGAGGGGGGGSNNTGSTGGGGGNGDSLTSFLSTGAFGGGGGGGGSGVSASGGGGNGGPGTIVLIYTAKTTMLPTTNLSFANIQSYFGGSNPISLDEYYRSVVTGTGLVSQAAQNNANTSIPSSGQISVNNFRGAPFKLYREIEAGFNQVTVGKGVFRYEYGFNSATSMGSISSTAFTLSGGAGVAITMIANDSDSGFIFQVSSTSAVSDSGWGYLIIDETTSANTIYARTAATFSGNATNGKWLWSTAYLAPATGSDFVVKFV
jgi:hypothetical protein